MSITSPDAETVAFVDLQETYDDFFVPQFTVTVNGEEFSEVDGVISDVSVDLALDKATQFSFTLNYPYNHEAGEFKGLDWDQFAPDRSVAIDMGYGDTEKTLVHEGHITAVKPKFPSGSSPTVGIEGYGKLHRLTSLPESAPDPGSLTRTWSDTPPHEVVQSVVDDRGYEFDVETVSEASSPPEIKQDESKNDLEFLLDLAETYAYELFSREGDLYFRPPRYDGPPDVVLHYGRSLDSFSPEVNEGGQVDRVEVRNWSAEQGEEIVGEATRDDLAGDDGQFANGGDSRSTTTETLRLPVRTTTQANERAKAELANRLDGTVSGDGDCIGLPEIRPGMRIGIDGLTDRFTNVYYVESATHSFGNNGYETSFSVKRRAL